MAAIPTIVMVKDGNEVIVNAPDRDKYLDAGFEDKKEEGAPAKQADPKAADPKAADPKAADGKPVADADAGK